MKNILVAVVMIVLVTFVAACVPRANTGVNANCSYCSEYDHCGDKYCARSKVSSWKINGKDIYSGMAQADIIKALGSPKYTSQSKETELYTVPGRIGVYERLTGATLYKWVYSGENKLICELTIKDGFLNSITLLFDRAEIEKALAAKTIAKEVVKEVKK